MTKKRVADESDDARLASCHLPFPEERYGSVKMDSKSGRSFLL